MEINDAIRALEKYVINPSKGLPDEVFYYVSRTTPLVNVDLLIRDENGRTLLSWRDDQYAGMGWHIPGGIIRFKETFETRIKKVAESEIGTKVEFDPVPLAVNQMINNRKNRGHFISILFNCFLSSKYPLDNRGLTERERGHLKWHDSCPFDLLKCQELYKKYI